ncbi:transposable element Tcb2 transposase [Trichonephila clavipes]|nr:transposable element Tcb2 transposase [Trichonephila clavipes]
MCNVTDWQKVVFSDESRFVLGTDDNHVLRLRHTVLRHTARPAGVMVWGAIAYDSRSTLIVMRGTLTGQRYVDDILRPHAVLLLFFFLLTIKVVTEYRYNNTSIPIVNLKKTLNLTAKRKQIAFALFRCQVIYSQFGLAIHQNDHQARRRFVEWAQNEIAVVPDFHKRILFSDEAHFWLNGYVNKQNCRIWREANPQVYVETPLHPEKLTVWCALWAGGILLQKR